MKFTSWSIYAWKAPPSNYWREFSSIEQFGIDKEFSRKDKSSSKTGFTRFGLGFWGMGHDPQTED